MAIAYHPRMHGSPASYSRGFARHALLASLLALVGSAVPALAQTGPFAVTLYGGTRSGSGFQQTQDPRDGIDMPQRAAASIALERPIDGQRQVQWLLAHQRTELRLQAGQALPLQITYLQFGGLNFFDGPVGQGPFVSGGLGLAYLSPNFPGTSSRMRAAGSLGVGYQWPIGRAASLRAELRGYATLLNSSGAFFCSGGCVVDIRGDTMVQAEAMIGLSIPF